MIISDNNFISKDSAQHFFKTVTSSAELSWHLAYRTDGADGYRQHEKTTSDVHESYQFVLVPEPWHPVYREAMDIFLAFVQKHNLSWEQILRLKLNILPRSGVSGKHHTPHIDRDDDHKVFLYYINDSDGDTFFFDKVRGDVLDEFNITESYSPEMGKGIVFDGNIYHASSSPVLNDMRCILNIDFK